MTFVTFIGFYHECRFVRHVKGIAFRFELYLMLYFEMSTWLYSTVVIVNSTLRHPNKITTLAACQDLLRTVENGDTMQNNRIEERRKFRYC